VVAYTRLGQAACDAHHSVTNFFCVQRGRFFSCKGRYSVRKMKWREQLNGDCPRRDAHSMYERCDRIYPDLPKVL